jgi:uncharacterized paraquat-inducible protein A
MTKCPECNSAVSEEAERCPKCGHPLSQWRASNVFFSGIVGAGGVMLLILLAVILLAILSRFSG